MIAVDKLVLTGSQRGGTVPPEALQMAKELGLRVVERNRRSLPRLLEETGCEAVLVWKSQGPVLYLGEEQFFFHPSMAKNRISMLRKGMGEDAMARAMGLKKGDRVLDCTLGLGADAIVASYIVGTEGKVTGVEKVSVLAYLVRYGLMHYETPMRDLETAMRRIEVINSDHLTFLKTVEDNSYDVVYFDPMFRHPVKKSQAISPLRRLAYPSPLSEESVREALRVAVRRVVIKERRGSKEFERLGCHEVLGGESSSIAYGIIKSDTEGGNR